MKTIFIGGCERSGTTFLGAILGSSKNCIVTPESHFKTTILSGRKNIENDPTQWKRLIADNFYFRLWNMEAPEAEPNQSFPDYLDKLVRQFQSKNQSEKSEPFVWIDHTPNNLKYAHTLSHFFPDAKFIHIIRDGRAIFYSMKNTNWGAKNVTDAALLWLRKISYGLAAENYFPKERVLRIRYEDLVLQPEIILQKLQAFTGLDDVSLQNDAMENILPAYTKKQHALVGKMPEASKATEWKQHLTKREIEIFESETRDMLEMLGYVSEYGAYAKGMTRFQSVSVRLTSYFHYRWSWIRNIIHKRNSVNNLK